MTPTTSDQGRTSPLSVIAGFVALMWLTSILGFFFPELLSHGALIPRVTDQWWGIWTAAFFHANLGHLTANTAPLLIFLFLLQHRGATHFYLALILCMTAAGIGLWCLGRNGAHIGASGLVFALFGFFLANAVLRRGVVDILIAFGVILAYWGLVFGLLPNDARISWDGHLLGLIGGVISSWLLSRYDRFARESVKSD